MNALRQALLDYLAVRRVLGYKLARAEKLLAQFLTYLEDRGENHLTTETALAWATLPAGAHRSWLSTRLSIVRRFAAHLRGIDPATEVPPADLLPGRTCRATPYLYSEEDITALITAAGALRTSHRKATYRTLIALLVVTGMRIGEAIGLDRDDFDAINGLLTIRNGKFGKSRELPLHPSSVNALSDYLCRTDQPPRRRSASALFVSTAGTRLLYTNVQNTFHQLVCCAGLTPRSASCRPRLHDIRHGFAIRTLLDAYRDGGDPGARLALLSTYLGHVDPGKTYWYLSAAPELLQLAGVRLERHLRGWRMTALATTLQAFFTDRLIRQRQASSHTIAAYRDTLRLMLGFASERCGTEPSKLDIDDLDAPLVGAFLDHLEHQRENGVRTRNARLAAIRSLFRYAALRHPEHAAVIERVLAIPPKRFDRRLVTFLTEPELDALLAAPARSTWTGRRDQALLGLAAQTGLRASELIGLRCADIHLGVGAHVSCLGKGRKLRITPLTSGMVAVLRVWFAERAGRPADPLFASQTGRALSRDALEHRLAKYVEIASRTFPSLRQKKVTMHILRHTAAMRLLRAGIETSVIALWLGHEQIETTQIYLHADLELKERALAKTTPAGTAPGRYRPPDKLLAFLEAL